MATAVVEFDSVDGQTLTLELYPFDSDTASFSVAATERSSNKGTYRANVVSPAEGWYNARAKNAAGNSLGKFHIRLRNVAQTFHAGDPSRPIEGAIEDGSFTLPAETGVPTGFVGALFWLACRLGLRRVVRDDTAKTIIVKDGSNATRTTNTYTSTGGTDDIGAAQ